MTREERSRKRTLECFGVLHHSVEVSAAANQLSEIMWSIPRVILYVSVALFSCAAEAKVQTNADYQKQAVHAGEQIFLARCFQCHSVNKGQVEFGPSLYGETNKSPHRKSPAQIRVIIENGKSKMPAFKQTIPDKDIDDLLAYIRSL